MKNLYKIEKDTRELDQFKIKDKQKVRSQDLIKEINNSNRRLLRTKAGIRLEKVIFESLERNKIDPEKVIYNSRKDMG